MWLAVIRPLQTEQLCTGAVAGGSIVCLGNMKERDYIPNEEDLVMIQINQYISSTDSLLLFSSFFYST
jgi:hypothetical protein